MKAGYEGNPLDDDSLEAFQVTRVPMTTLCQRAAEAVEGEQPRRAEGAQPVRAGLVCWMYDRPTAGTERGSRRSSAASRWCAT